MLRKQPILLSILIVSYLLLLFLAWYNTLADDDLLMWAAVKREGVLGATLEQYRSWNTRWMSFLFLHTWLYFLNPQSSLFLYHLFTFCMLFAAFKRIVDSPEIKSALQFRDNSAFAAGLGVLALFICTYNIGDTWFWINTSTMYGWNLIVLIYAFSLVLRPLGSSSLQSALLNVCGLYVGGAAEPAAILVLILIPAFLLLKKDQAAPYKSNIIHFLTGLCIAFAIAFAGEGHSRREAALPDLSLLNLVLHSVYFSLKIILWHSPLRWLCALGLLTAVFRQRTNSPRNPLRDALLALSAWIAVVVVHTSFITYIMGDYGPARAWSFLSLWLVVCSSWWLYHHTGQIRVKVLWGLQFISLVLIVGTALQQLRVIPEYARMVKEINEGRRPYEDQKLPDHGLLHRMNGLR